MAVCAALSVTIGVVGVVGAQAASAAPSAAAAAGPSLRADFNRDGFADLAVGAPGENSRRGVVNVIYGSASGLSARRNQYWTQDSAGIIGVAEVDDLFGSALAAGDFNGDGFADLAVGVPGKNDNRGAVNVIYGSARGLTAAGNQGWTKNTPGIIGVAAAGDQFGLALAVANFGKSGHTDLAVGAPNSLTEDDRPLYNTNGGSVNVLYGSTRGLTAAGDQHWTQDTPGIIGVAAVGERFGNSLAAANFGKSGYADLAIGVPSDGAGAVNVIYGSATGLTPTGDQHWTQNSLGITGAAPDGYFFGLSLTTANFGKSGYADLALGSLGQEEVYVIYGSAAGLSATGAQVWTQDSPYINGVAHLGDAFGLALAAGDFNGDGFADLAVGAYGDNNLGIVDSDWARGAVNVIYGSAGGLTAAGDQYWTQDSTGIIGSAEVADFFGWALAVGDFDGDGFADLAVGAPGENSRRGVVSVIYGSTRGLAAAGNQYWTGDSAGLIGTAEIGDGFGRGLVSGG
jgi:hypothetical protein